ncbi:MAG: arsenite efflux transporter metallochaperone ArsD [Heliobacteriaceae bacterium]|nr:arsenite efflux transporter metallochaperone ArsD [Heliobacteriaceae bacterium]
MKKMSIYEPAMCCDTGVCGVGVDPELLRISTALSNLKKSGVEVKRYNLNTFPQEFIKNEEINKLIMGDGVESLPATIVDGKIVMTKRYPTNAEIAELLGVPKSYLGEEKKPSRVNSGNSCCGNGGCC